MSRLVRVEWQTERRALTLEHRLREAERERIDGLRELQRVLGELHKVLSGRRYRLAQALAKPLAFLRRRRVSPSAGALASAVTVGPGEMDSETHYAQSADGSNIAYQVHGEGPSNLVFVSGFVSHAELFWEEPAIAGFLRRLASFSRLVTYDKRGQGLSDRPGRPPTLEESMDDLRAVMDAADCERAAIFGISEGGPLSALFAATHPDRVSSLVLYGTYARLTEAPDYPEGIRADRFEEWTRRVRREWGGAVGTRALGPERGRQSRVRAMVGAAPAPGTSPAGADRSAEPLPRDRCPQRPAERSRPRLWSCTERATGWSRWRRAATWRSRSPTPVWSSSPARTTSSSSATAAPLLDEVEEFLVGSRQARDVGPRARDGALHRHRRLDRDRRRGSATALARAARPPRLGGAARARSASRPRGEDHGRRLPRHLRRPGPGDPLRRLDPRRPASSSGSRSGRASTPARSRRSATTSAASPSTSAPGRRSSPGPARCWCRAR